MEKLRKAVKEIAYARDHTKLTALHRSLLPLLSFASSLYGLALSLRHLLYRFSAFKHHRLPVPVISVGNITWGGNGKTPMVEYIARCFLDSGISPLILTRGYAGGDEAKMLERHLLDLAVKIGIGANRAASAAWFLKKYGYLNPWNVTRLFDGCSQAAGDEIISEKIGVAILDDGMQHWSLCRHLEIVMLNGLNPWGNSSLIPLGPLREPLTALGRADIAVVHHADLVPEQNLRDIELTIRKFQNSIPIFYSRMTPKYLFDSKFARAHVPLEVLCKAKVLCVSAIGSADAFVKSIQKIGADYIDRIDFSDHHAFQSEDINIIRKRLQQLEQKFNSQPIVVITEKDYDRDREILLHLDSYTVFVLCSELQFLPCQGNTSERFKSTLTRALAAKFLVSS